MSRRNIVPLLSTERRAIGSLASIYFLRMFGLFLILPVFALYAERLDGHTAALTGLAIGIYGLTQALLQIPFGLASDRFGRKPVITVGLILFAFGSVVAATSAHIGGVIIGRALQGSGAIAAAVMALNADLTREVVRTKAMAVIGMSIGAAFFAAMLGGPILNQWVGVPGLFWLTATLALIGLVVIHTITPNPAHSRVHRDAEPVPEQLGQVLRDPQLLRLDAGIFLLHMTLTALFIGVPLALRDQVGLPSAEHWKLYFPVMLLSIPAMVPFVILAEAKGKMKAVFLGAVAVIGLAQVALAWWHSNVWWIGVVLFAFFSAFNILEATLPSLISKLAPPDKKGSAMGVYSSGQFLGAFVGGSLGGIMLGTYGIVGVFSLTAVAAALWLFIAVGMRAPTGLSNYLLDVGVCDEAEASALGQRLRAVEGVAEAVVVPQDGVAYLKVNQRLLDEESLRAFGVADRA